MRTYNILAADRKEVKTKIEELAGKKAAYSGAPDFAYTLDGITIGNDGTVTAEGKEAETLLQNLVEAGLLEAVTEAATAPVLGETDEAEEVPAGEENAQETAQNAETGEAQEAPVTGDAPGSEEVRPDISMPLSQHTPESLCNLIFMIYAKGDLLSRSSGGSFFVSEALKEKLKDGAFTDKDKVLEILNGCVEGDLRGLTFTDDKVTFIGFPRTQDVDLLHAWTHLAAAINRAAITQKRVLPRRNAETNEKFAFRTWLTRLGMNGPELKAERQLYYRNLTGHTAFRTPADEAKWKKRQAQRKEERKAAQEAADAAENTQAAEA